MTARTAAPWGVLARTPVAPLPPSCPKRPMDVTARTSARPEMPPPELCSFQLPKTCSFRLPLTTRRDASRNSPRPLFLGSGRRACGGRLASCSASRSATPREWLGQYGLKGRDGRPRRGIVGNAARARAINGPATRPGVRPARDWKPHPRPVRVYQRSVPWPRARVIAPPSSALSWRCASTPSSKFRLPPSSTRSR